MSINIKTINISLEVSYEPLPGCSTEYLVNAVRNACESAINHELLRSTPLMAAILMTIFQWWQKSIGLAKLQQMFPVFSCISGIAIWQGSFRSRIG